MFETSEVIGKQNGRNSRTLNERSPSRKEEACLIQKIKTLPMADLLPIQEENFLLTTIEMTTSEVIR